MKRKVYAVMLACLIMVFSFSGCKSDASKDASGTSSKPTSSETIPRGDDSSNAESIDSSVSDVSAPESDTDQSSKLTESTRNIPAISSQATASSHNRVIVSAPSDSSKNMQEALLEFDNPRGLFGEISINIIGDSISQGLNSEKLYDNSWAALFKKAIGNRFDAYNIGYTSLNCEDISSGYTNREIHTVTSQSGTWNRFSHSTCKTTPGNCRYESPADSGTDSTLRISLDRNKDGIDRHINGFYIYYTAGTEYGSFEVKINGNVVATVNCVSEILNECARSKYIALPAGCGNELTIDIVKKETDKKVSVNGISYIDKPNTVTVNNYSLSAIKLNDYDDALLEKLCQANIVIFTLGTNDVYGAIKPNLFVRKLEIVKKACKENGSILIVGDVIWPRDYDVNFGSRYKAALKACAEEANGYYIDFCTLYAENPSSFLSDNIAEPKDENGNYPKDPSHPSIEGHRLMADKLCEFFGLKLK